MSIQCTSDAFYILVSGAKFFKLFALKATTVIGADGPWSSIIRTTFVKNFITVRVSVHLQICAVNYLLKRSTATKI